MQFTTIKTFIRDTVLSKFEVRHFSRFILLQGGRKGQQPAKEVPSGMADALLGAAKQPVEDILREKQTTVNGLSCEERAVRLEQTGPNEVGLGAPVGFLTHLWLCYRNPFNLLLTVLAIISFFTEDIEATLVIGFMVIISTIMRLVQEVRSNRAAEQLKAMVSTTATVLCTNSQAMNTPENSSYFATRRIFGDIQGDLLPQEFPIASLVPGDIVLLSAGDMVPADVRIISAKDLFVAQSALTGESLPVEKYVDCKPDIRNVLELENIAFMGTNVVSGTAKAVVLNTGAQTYFGALAEKVMDASPRETSFQLGVNKVSWLLIRFMLVMVPIVLLLNGFLKGDWLEAALFALSIAVGLTPEMLPMIVTSTLARGAVCLSRQKVIVKRLDAIQNLGAMQILCTDKTGTLTQDKICLERHMDVLGETSDEVLKHAFLNSYYQTGLKNLLDVAVLEHVAVSSHQDWQTHYHKVDEIPFDFQRRRMSVVVRHHSGVIELITKGALEEILAVCTSVQYDGQVTQITPELLAEIRAITAVMNAEGLRVVAVASRVMPDEREVYTLQDETDLTLLGYIAFLDPPKETAAPALAALQAHGIEVKILTGDNELVTRRVCSDVGLAADKVLLGEDIDLLDDAQLLKQALAISVFAKLNPQHKERIVRVLHDADYTIGFMGDGINDAPALRAADVGISVDSAVDIAREAADLILLEKSLMVLEAGVEEGRKTSANMLKYIKMTASSNFGNVFSVLIASAFLPFLPMLPIHLLVQNLLYDISQIALPFDNVDAEFLEKPQRWDANEIGRFMVFFGPLSSVFDVLTFVLLWHVFGADSVSSQTLFQSGWFVEGLLSQLLIVHMIRTRKIPFVQSRASWVLISVSLLIVAIGIFLPMGQFAPYFKMQALPWSYFPWLILILFGYMGLVQAVKGFYIRRYGWQ